MGQIETAREEEKKDFEIDDGMNSVRMVVWRDLPPNAFEPVKSMMMQGCVQIES
jgi:hypothetical protein